MLAKIIGRVFVVLIGLVILFVSVARAGLSLMAQDGDMDSLRNEEVKFLVTFDDGETASGTYKLPQAGMLPNNVFYGFKKVRDYIWMSLSGGEDKVKLAVLMADKKIAEFQKLTEKGERGLAVESGNEAVDKLEYANGLVMGAKNVDAQSKQIRKQILWAGLAYGEIFHRNEKEFQIDSEKYTKLLIRIDGWNKQQEKNRYTWNY
ncbi:MAG: DUF5667 domain-containing protein [Candidatus Shapirobacteria bacterium]|jgi:hypothetical protein